VSEYRAGDRIINIGGVRTRLRFSLSALAEMAELMRAESPSDLARGLRKAGVAEWNLILQALAMPRPETPLNEDLLAELLPTLSAVSEFWAMPVRDWLGLLNGLNTPGLDRSAFEKLLEIYPDEES